MFVFGLELLLCIGCPVFVRLGIDQNVYTH